ncbi:unnamed protein product [Prunus armeniaca]|uniref:Uncharacterized protein n=1 Tax=Prunus armeniaca TaxID=36596 RepID=A0A6J5XJY1_PRUAR|nr:unnamed protein product [Prunus armeniaca]
MVDDLMEQRTEIHVADLKWLGAWDLSLLDGRRSKGLKLVHCKGTSYTAAVGCWILWFFESLTFTEGGFGYRIRTEHRLAFGIWYCLRKLVFYLHQSSLN